MNKTSSVGRSLWYVLRTALIVLVVLAAGFFVFQMGLGGSNIYILATEGMLLRAECVLEEASRDALTEYFTPEFLQGDERLAGDTYSKYTISDYNYVLNVESVSVLPWSSRASMQVVERVERLTGQINKDSLEDGADASNFPVPEWEAGRYRVAFSRIGERWYISGLELLEAAPSEAPKRTPLVTPAPSGAAQ